MVNDAETDLLEDAKLVLTYAVRAGRLRDDTLPNAIREVEASLGTGGLASLVPLGHAMNVVVKAIAPITLSDLRAGRSPFDRDSLKSVSRMQLLLSALTVLLALFIAFYSFVVQGKEGALRAYQETSAANIQDKVNALYRLSQLEEVRIRKDPRYEQYQHSLNEIQTLDARDQSAVSLLAEQAEAIWFPFQNVVLAAMDSITSWLQGILGLQVVIPELTQNPSPYSDMCKEWAQAALATSRADKAGSLTWKQAVSYENSDKYCFKQMMGIKHEMEMEATLLRYVNAIRANVMLINVWILPFLSGLLGATVFLLRDSLSPLTANFGLAHLFVRLALGGVSGILIGWFWVPSGTLGTDVSKGSPVSMALAFIAGFSIDILFSMLDRFKRTLNSREVSSKDSPNQ